jgi:hypothetical protein
MEKRVDEDESNRGGLRGRRRTELGDPRRGRLKENSDKGNTIEYNSNRDASSYLL